VHKRTEATVQDKDGKTFKVTKGAPQVILALSANAGQVKSAVDKAVNEFAARGFRSLGVARAEDKGSWQFIGVLPLFDPPRDDAKATIATALTMGVKIKMVTGDALAIARETAQKLNMGTNILDAGGLGDSKKQETATVAESIEKADGFAQVFPEHKFHIVDVLQKLKHIATLIAVYGFFMIPLGWGWALFVWGYALAWFLVNDRVKLLAYRIIDPVVHVAQQSLTPRIQ
jgi:H+-transporting ATPase